MALEKLIAAQRKQAQATINQQVGNIQGTLDSTLSDLQYESGEVGASYDQLKRDAQRTYEQNLIQTRGSAIMRGVGRSGILSNQEMKHGTAYSEQTTQYEGERTRRLQDISRRRTLMQKQAKDEIKNVRAKGSADLGAYIADVRYQDYVRKQQEAARAREIAASNAASNRAQSLAEEKFAWEKGQAAKENTPEFMAAQFLDQKPEKTSGAEWARIARNIKATYGADSVKKGSAVDEMLNSYFTYGKTQPAQGGGRFNLSSIWNSGGGGTSSITTPTYKGPAAIPGFKYQPPNILKR